MYFNVARNLAFESRNSILKSIFTQVDPGFALEEFAAADGADEQVVIAFDIDVAGDFAFDVAHHMGEDW